MKKIIVTVAALFLAVSFCHRVYAQEARLIPDTESFHKAKVLSAVSQEHGGLHQKGEVSQEVRVELLDGSSKGRVVTFGNDATQVSSGDMVYIRHIVDHLHGDEYFSVADPYRLPVVGSVCLLFFVLIGIFGGTQGLRGLISLSGSVVLIVYVLIPNVYQGVSAVYVSLGVALLITTVGSYITHGFTRTTSSAVLGMIVTVCITGLVTYYGVYGGKLTGFSSEESTYLSLNTQGAIDMVGLLFGGMMIGLLGVLYDIAIGQAVAIEELYRMGNQVSRKEVYARGIRIGKEHIGALVNTLAIAYVGASLPLLLLVTRSDSGFWFIVNSEIFATEIIRIAVGGIGLVLAVPVTTAIASYMLYGKTETQARHHGHRH